MSFQKLSPELLRQHKGVSFTGISVIFFCHDGKGNIFLTKRSKNARDEHGTWAPGAGGLKHGNAVEDEVRRELQEEHGVEPLHTTFLGYFDAFRSSPEDLPTHWLLMCFAVQVDPAAIKN